MLKPKRPPHPFVALKSYQQPELEPLDGPRVHVASEVWRRSRCIVTGCSRQLPIYVHRFTRDGDYETPNDAEIQASFDWFDEPPAPERRCALCNWPKALGAGGGAC